MCISNWFNTIVEKTIIFPLNCISTFVVSLTTIYVWVCFWPLLFVLLIYLFLNISLNLPASFTCRVIPDSAWRLLQILFMIWNNNCSRSTLSYLLRDFCSHLHWFLCLSIRPKPPRLLPSSPGIFPLSPNPIQSSFTWIFASAPFLFHLSQP